jgi:hypothetical protein
LRLTEDSQAANAWLFGISREAAIHNSPADCLKTGLFNPTALDDRPAWRGAALARNRRPRDICFDVRMAGNLLKQAAPGNVSTRVSLLARRVFGAPDELTLVRVLRTKRFFVSQFPDEQELVPTDILRSNS